MSRTFRLRKLGLAVAGCLLLGAGSSSWAACSGHNCTNVLVDTLYLEPNGNLYIGTSGVEKQLSCTPTSDVYIVLSGDVKHFGSTFSTLAAHQLANKPIEIRTSSSGQCRVNYFVFGKRAR